MPIVHQCIQGDQAWHDLRLGRPTSSRFGDIVTPTGALSKSSERYAAELAAADFLGVSLDTVQSPWMNRGKIQEPEALSYVEFVQGIKIEKVGCVSTDDGLVFSSPDGLIDNDGVVEIKIKETTNHVLALLNPYPKEHWPQTQGQLFVTGRQYCLLCHYNPELPSLVTRIERNEEYIERLRAALYDGNDDGPGFLERLQAAKARLAELAGGVSNVACGSCGGRVDVQMLDGKPFCAACITRMELEIFGNDLLGSPQRKEINEALRCIIMEKRAVSNCGGRPAKSRTRSV